MDHRTALKPNTTLRLCNDKGEVIQCIIENELGRGGSCIVYEAARITDTGDKSLYRVKEFYPYKLDITRGEDNVLTPSENDAKTFNQLQEQLRIDFSRTNQLYYSDSNYSSMTNQLDVFKENGTSYILSSYSSKKTLMTYKPQSIKECVSLLKQVVYVLGNIHHQGYLYLDVKPENILVVDGYQKQIQLFDFDSLFSVENLHRSVRTNKCDVRLSYSKGFAPIELQTSKINHIGPHSDVYSVGALLFFLLFGVTPAAPDCETGAEYDFTKLQYDYRYCDDRLFGALCSFFHNTLAVYYADRYQSMREVMDQLQIIITYADQTVPRIFSTKIDKARNFCGREHEFDEMDRLLATTGSSCLFLTGMGGIGKSTFIREYLISRQNVFDTALYVPFKDSIETTICDDNNVEINTMRQDEETKTGARYFDKKIRKIRELVRGSFSVLVIDNFDGEVDDDLLALLGTGLKVILVTRNAATYQNCQEMKLAALKDTDALQRIFEYNLGRPVTDDEQLGFEEILQRIDRHTLVLELIAKQVANSHISVLEAAVLTTKHGFSSIAPEKVDYEKDKKQTSDRIGSIIDALFEADGLSEEKRILLKVASLLGDTGIDINQFQVIMELTSKDDLNDLIQTGWLMKSGDVISMHNVIQEAVHRWEWNPEYINAVEQLLTYFFLEIRIEATQNNYPKRLRKDRLREFIDNPPQYSDRRIDQRLLEQRERMLKKANERSEVYFEKKGLVGKLARARIARNKDQSPANVEKIRALLLQAEDILGKCKREPTIKATNLYLNLLCETVLDIPEYREEYIMREISDIFSSTNNDIVMSGMSELLIENGSLNALKTMQLYVRLVEAAIDSKRIDEAEKHIEKAKRLADKVHDNRIYAMYYDLLSSYYDSLLDGAYYTTDPDEIRLLNRLLDSIEKTLRYSKHYRSKDGDHLYAKNLLAKALVLMRSGRDTKVDIGYLLETAKKVIEENTMQYADVRLHYYLNCAWYFALELNSEELTEKYIGYARELADITIPTDWQKIANVIIPSANMFYELHSYVNAVKLLYEGTRLCEKHVNVDSYVRIKQELSDHLCEVGINAQMFRFCRAFIEMIDAENAELVDPQNKVVISDEIRRIIWEKTK